MRKLISALICVILAGGCDFGSSAGFVSTPGQERSLDTIMEVPATSKEDNIIRHKGYIASYNTSTLIPNWVAYELTREEAKGTEERNERMFDTDPSFNLRQAQWADYSNSGWTKGHMAPAKDFAWDSTAMDETFYFINCCPQNETLNRHYWEYLERKVRDWAGRYGKVWVVTGPIIGEDRYGTIGKRHVVVPDAFFKALLTERNGSFKSIAFIMDNDGSEQLIKDCAVTVNELEEITGLDLFPCLDDKFEENVENQLRLREWGI